MARAAVVGGGFWGLSMALALARAGARVYLFEEHGRAGVPEHCTGLVSRRVVEYLGWPVASSVVAWFPGFRLCGPSRCVYLEPEGGVYKLDRRLVEERLLDAAVGEGVEALLGVRVTRVSSDGWVDARGRTGRFDLVVLAEGASGRLRRRLGIGYTRPPPVHGVNAVYEAPCRWRGGFTASFTRESRGFFTWTVPLPGGLCLAGAGSSEPRLLGRALRAAVEAGVEGGAGAGVARSYGGPLPLGGPARRLRAGRVVAAGDAAGLVKQLTGGGLYPAAEAFRALSGLSEPPGPAAVESALRRVARVLAGQARPARLLLSSPGLVDCIAGALESSGLAGALAGAIDYDVHQRIPLQAAARAPGRTLRALAAALASCPSGVARLALAGLAGLLPL